MKRFSWSILFFTISLLLYAQESPYNSESRFQLAGFYQPQRDIYYTSIPLLSEDATELNLDTEELWIFYFIDSHHPHFLEEHELFTEFQALWSPRGVEALIINAQGTMGYRDSHNRCASLFGFTIKPATAIINGKGKLIAWKEGVSMDWQNGEFTAAMDDLLLY